MNTLKNKKILFTNRRNWAFKIGRYLCKKFQDEGAILGCVTFRKDVNQFIKKKSDENYKIIDGILILAKKKILTKFKKNFGGGIEAKWGS